MNCALGKRGRVSTEWCKKGKAQIYCYGWTDKSTDSLLPECQKCADHVDKAQEDYEEWLKKMWEVEE